MTKDLQEEKAGAVKGEKEIVLDAATMARFPEEVDRNLARGRQNATIILEARRRKLDADKAQLLEDRTRLAVYRARAEAREKNEFEPMQKAIDALKASIAKDEPVLIADELAASKLV